MAEKKRWGKKRFRRRRKGELRGDVFYGGRRMGWRETIGLGEGQDQK